MNPADQRISELLDKWVQSLELHLRYTSLTDEAYWQVQPWIKHQRPARWIVEHALERARALQRQLGTRIGRGDDGFAESLEQMAFLANLVGAQNIERFIPLAEAASENKEALNQTRTSAVPPLSTGNTTRSAIALTEATREMPRPAPANKAGSALDDTASRPGAAPRRVEKPVPRPADKAAEKTADKRPAPKRELRPARETRSAPRAAPAADVSGGVVADAVRLLNWGREWHELAEAISRMAGRPSVTEVRRILRARKADIEKQISR
jgi:hypothetical protein